MSNNSRKDQEFTEPDKKGEQIDFKHRYNLPSDAIVSVSEVIEETRKRPYPKTSFEDLQKRVADIQLIPKVPDPVKQVFKCAKDLYIFGHFKYIFFTVSSHYASLAVESALKNRYSQSLGGKAILALKGRKIHEIANPIYRDIDEFCFQSKVDRRKLVVNGEPFPHSMPKLLNWMVEKRIIAKWEQFSYDSSKDLRNALSHLEFAPTLIPDPMTLDRVAYQINRLFHQVDEKH